MIEIRVPGFRFAGIHCGVKKGKKKDLSLILSDRPASAAAIFTTNRVKAAPVLVGMRRVRSGKIQAVVVNSGNANACTGPGGMRDAEDMCREAARHLDVDPKLVFPSSTGAIGVPLPMEKIRRGIARAAGLLSPRSSAHAAEGILTTDRFPKAAMTRCRLGGKRVAVAGIAKGAGMIAPRMATMLAYVLTDAVVAPSSLRGILRRSAERSFQAITVDGDMSTNDTVLLLANGSAGNRPVAGGSKGERVLEQGVTKVMRELALMVVRDGEGTTKVAEILVEGARRAAEARKIAFAVANSKLVKTAFFGADPNVGRILAAVGYAGVSIDPDRIDVFLDRVKVAGKGVVLGAREREASRVLKRSSFRVRIGLHQGTASSAVWTSDLSHEYVRINSAYRT